MQIINLLFYYKLSTVAKWLGARLLAIQVIPSSTVSEWHTMLKDLNLNATATSELDKRVDFADLDFGPHGMF